MPPITFSRFDNCPGPRVPYVDLDFDEYGGYTVSEHTYLYLNMDYQLGLSERPIEIPPKIIFDDKSYTEPTIFAARDTGGEIYASGFPELIRPRYVFDNHVPKFLVPERYEKNPELPMQFAKLQALEESEDKVCLDATSVKPGREALYVDAKYFYDLETFNKTFNIHDGTGIESVNKWTVAQSTKKRKREKKITDIPDGPVAPWRERECKKQKCLHKKTCATKGQHVIMRRVENEEFGPVEERMSTEAKRLNSKKSKTDIGKKRAVNSWIAYRTYYQSTFKPEHHQSQVSGKIKALYDELTDDERVRWAALAKEYTLRRDSFPGASRAWLTAMLTTIVSNAGLNKERDTPPEIAVEPLLDLPEEINPATMHTAKSIAESHKRAREADEIDWERIPKKARMIYEMKKKRKNMLEEKPERPIKKTRVLKGPTESEYLGYDNEYIAPWGSLSCVESMSETLSDISEAIPKNKPMDIPAYNLPDILQNSATDDDFTDASFGSMIDNFIGDFINNPLQDSSAESESESEVHFPDDSTVGTDDTPDTSFGSADEVVTIPSDIGTEKLKKD
ncbi:hypothetical protein ABW20_dc0107963 [Dactylellina cionopaga]|nr:hypothetical protein ABW20_dc0107963 [Dactylellina cionopaga]